MYSFVDKHLFICKKVFTGLDILWRIQHVSWYNLLYKLNEFGENILTHFTDYILMFVKAEEWHCPVKKYLHVT